MKKLLAQYMVDSVTLAFFLLFPHKPANSLTLLDGVPAGPDI